MLCKFRLTLTALVGWAMGKRRRLDSHQLLAGTALQPRAADALASPSGDLPDERTRAALRAPVRRLSENACHSASKSENPDRHCLIPVGVSRETDWQLVQQANFRRGRYR